MAPRTDRPDLEKRKPKFVYFARGRSNGLIKIGCSINPQARTADLKFETGEDVQVLFTIPGNRVQEKGYQKRFGEYRVRGEWFHESGRLHEFLKGRGHGGTRTIIEKQVLLQPAPTRIVEVLKHRDLTEIAPIPLAIGYARVSTYDQNLDVQITALLKAGVLAENMYVEKISAVNAKRPQFHLMMKFLERGDTMFVHALSRLGRNIMQVHGILNDLQGRGVLWHSLTEQHLDGTTAIGRFMVSMTAAKDQLERDQIKERTERGMEEKRRQGQYLGRPPGAAKIAAMIADRKKKMTAEQIATKHKVAIETVNQYAPRKRAA